MGHFHRIYNLSLFLPLFFPSSHLFFLSSYVTLSLYLQMSNKKSLNKILTIFKYSLISYVIYSCGHAVNPPPHLLSRLQCQIEKKMGLNYIKSINVYFLPFYTPPSFIVFFLLFSVFLSFFFFFLFFFPFFLRATVAGSSRAVYWSL